VLQISVLGPVEVRRDGQLLPVPGGKASELLVRLALEAGTFVRTDRLLDELWGGALDTRRNTLQSKVTRLRRAFGDPLAIVGGDGGYRLAVEPSRVDALAALRDTAAAARLLDAGDDRGAGDLSASTLSLYRGEIHQAAGDGDWAAPHRTRLDEARMKLIEIRFSARLRLGDAGDAIGELEAAVATYPYQEGLWELLITALYRAGRQADALARWRHVRTLLADELGLDPGPRLQQLERQILRHDSSLSVADRPAPAPPAAPPPPVGNLPSMSSELVGRAEVIASVTDLLGATRLVEIVGPGGIGKTAVAIATGRQLAKPGGVWLARLDSATTTGEVLDTVIVAMNVTGGEPALLERLKGSASVLILDNCEHVVDAAATLATRLLDAAPRLRILGTSQTPLDVDGETVYELAPLALADAVELFARRAPRGDRSPGAVDDAVQDLCRSLDGLPLAIELAAARTKTLSIEEITRRLDDRFSVLSDPASRRPPRRRALRATIGWSYELLFPDDKRGLWALATFAGGAPLPAVEHVLEAIDVPASAAIDVVGRLASRSLVIVDGDGVSGPVRYRLLDSIRAFALEAMAQHELTERARGAHAAWFADAASSSTQGVRSGRQAEHLAFARSERANIDAALAWTAAHDPPLGLRIVKGFGWAWIVLGDSRGAQRILAALDAAGDAAPIADRASALLLAAWIEASTGRLQLAREHIGVATELADAIGDVDLQARCSYYLAYVVSHHGDFAAAMELTYRANALYGELDRPWDQAANWLFASRAAISAVDLGRAAHARDQVDRWLQRVDDPWLHVRRDAMLGELARIEHRFDDAVRHIDRAASTSGRLGFLQTEAYQVSSLGRAQCQAGDYAAGAATLSTAVEKAEATGDVRLAALARVHLGRVLRALGRVGPARTALEEAAAWHRAAAGGEQALLGECLLAALDAGDRVAGAQERLVAILDDARRGDDAPVEVFALDALARIAAQEGDAPTARELCEVADRRIDAASHFIAELDRTDARAVRQMAGSARRAGSAPRSTAGR
jgi:predicted ATPase/DNA-binding SARP family transcriptional activator